jgi:hypothetical protein
LTVNKPSSRVELRFHGVRRGLQIRDAVILEQLLMLEPSYAARRLANRLTAAIVTGSQVKLNAYEFVALSSLMDEVDIDRYAGLRKLKKTCAELTPSPLRALDPRVKL